MESVNLLLALIRENMVVHQCIVLQNQRDKLTILVDSREINGAQVNTFQ